MIKQLSVFLENDKGRLSSLCRTLSDAGISMAALTIADTSDYGIVRLVCDTPERAKEILAEAGFRVRCVEVAAIKVDNEIGGLARLLEAFDDANINMEYAYCFAGKYEYAIVIIKINPIESAREVVEKAGFSCVPPEEVYVLD